MDIVAKSNIFEVIRIVKPTKAKFFQDLLVGDKLEFSTSIGYQGRRRQGCAPGIVDIYKLGGGEWTATMNDFGNRIVNFELKEIN